MPSPDAATREMGGAQLTAHGTIVGTPDYMSPEQVKGAAARRAIRPFFLRRDAGRDDRRAASVPQAIHDGDLFRRAPRTARARRRHPSGGDGRAAASAGQGCRGSLRVRRGCARRSGARWPGRPGRPASTSRSRPARAWLESAGRGRARHPRRRSGGVSARAFRTSCARPRARRKRRSRPVSFDRSPCFRSTTTRAIPTRTISPKG